MKTQNSRLGLISLVCLVSVVTSPIGGAQSPSLAATPERLQLDAPASDGPAHRQDLAEPLRHQAGGQAHPAYHADAGRVRSSGASPSFSDLVVTKLPDTDDGTCDADCSLREAIAQAGSGDTVRFTPGLSGTITLGSQLVIAEDLTIDGPGADVITVSGNDAVRVFTITSSVQLDLNGLTIANGNATGDGGGIYNAGTLVLTGSWVISSTTSGMGGGIHNVGTLTIISGTVSSNTSTGSGGGIYSDGGPVTITNSLFSNNSGRAGGALFNRPGKTVMVANSTFSGNSAELDGGGFYNSGILTVTSSIVMSNTAYVGASQSGGGGFHHDGGTLTIDETAIISNTSAKNGGGIRVSNSGTALVLNNSLLRANTATTQSGGGVYATSSANVTIGNSTFVDNAASTAAGGLHSTEYATVVITNSTLVDNAAGAGNNLAADSNGSITLKNAIVANNTGGTNCSGTITDGGNNLQYPDTSCGGTIPSADPLLGPLQDNGGETLTMALLQGSPAIDAGNNAVCVAAPVNNADQRGIFRPIDGDGDYDAVCDIGAYEYGMEWVLEGENSGDGFGSVATAGDVNGDGYADVIVGASRYLSDTGRAYVFLGSANGVDATPALTLTGENTGDYFGNSVATAGDVNGDGYADVIVGAWGYQSNAGRAYVYLGSAGGLAATPALTLTGTAADDRFGISVAAAGDVNADGHGDVIVGADGNHGVPGLAYIYLGGASGLSATPTFTATGEASGDLFGFSVGTAGDVNGDGYADVIVGARQNGAAGRAYVYAGNAGGVSITPAYTLTGAIDDGEFGVSVATAGDVNGDGYADVVIGAISYDVSRGRAYVYLGGVGGLDTTPAFTATGETNLNYFGYWVDTAGDMNGDGYADVIIGAEAYNGNTGRAYVYLGDAGGLSASAALTLTGESPDSYFGRPAAPAGDVNGDGYADIIVGAVGYDANRGRAYLYYGSLGDPSAMPVVTFTGENASDFLGSVATVGDINGDGYGDVAMSAVGYPSGTQRGHVSVHLGSAGGLSSTPILTLTGESANHTFGATVAPAGDVNGDGYADFMVGATFYLTHTGRVYLYAGSAGSLSASPILTLTGEVMGGTFGHTIAAGDVNGDGYPDVIIGAPHVSGIRGSVYLYMGGSGGLNATPALTLTGETIGSGFGAWATMAGDLNRDGYSDVVIGANGYLTSTGRVYGFLGSAEGLSATPAFTLTGENTNDGFGSFMTAGDVDGDGYADLIVGANGYPEGNCRGRVYVYLGSDAGLNTTPELILAGENDIDYFGAWESVGDVNGDGYADVVVGAWGYPNNGRTGRAYLYLGSAGGLSASPAITWTGESPGLQYFGQASAIGDVTGDGYADVMVGAPYAVGAKGRVYLYLGNGSAGLALRPQQMRSDGSVPITHLGRSDSGGAFRLALAGRTPFGRGKVKLEWEVNPLGEVFDGTDTQQSASWMDTGTAGAALNELVSGLTADTAYHWRVRLRYHPATTPFQQYSRWVTVPRNGWNEQDLRTAEASVQFAAETFAVGEDGGASVITVTLSAVAPATATVDYATDDGTAIAGDDYVAASGTLTFAPGTTTLTFTVPITDDNPYEGDETVSLALESPTGAVLGTSSATLTIEDDDPPPVVAFSSSAYSVGEATGPALITVTLSGATALTAAVDYDTSDGTAIAGDDYTAASGTLTFVPGTTTLTFTVPITDDDACENDETIALALSGPVSATLGTSSATLTVTNKVIYGVEITPPSDAQSGDPGETVTYTLRITNTGNCGDTFGIGVSGNGWTTDAPSSAGPLAAGAGADVEVTVQVPPGAGCGDLDDVDVTATSQGDGSTSDSSALTTSANPVYGMEMALPLDAQSGEAGTVVAYTLHITNTGNCADTFGLAHASSRGWTVAYGTPVGVGYEQVAMVTFSVTVPSDVLSGTVDTTVITATSQADGSVWASVTAVTTATTGYRYVYLPLVLRDYRPYFAGPCEREDNDSFSQANGPLHSGMDYCGYPDDARDYFSIYVGTGGTITVDLTEHVGKGVQLQLFYQSGSRLAYVWQEPYHIEHTGQPGWYYIFIYTESGYSTTEPYTLRVTYPQ